MPEEVAGQAFRHIRPQCVLQVRIGFDFGDITEQEIAILEAMCETPRQHSSHMVLHRVREIDAAGVHKYLEYADHFRKACDNHEFIHVKGMNSISEHVDHAPPSPSLPSWKSHRRRMRLWSP